MKRWITFLICAVMFAAAFLFCPAEAFASSAGKAKAIQGAGKKHTSYAVLSGISVTAGKLNRAFAAKRLAYTLTLGETEGTTVITPVKADAAAKVTINKMAVDSITVSLKNGAKKTVSIKVTMPGKKSRTYTIKVVRKKSSNNFLARLSFSGGTPDKAFDPAVTEYSLKLDAYTPTVTIRAAKQSPQATLRIDGRTVSKKTYTLSPGAKRTVKITVRSQTGKTKTYRVRMQRETSPFANKTEALIDFAKHYLGKPYVRSGKGPDNFDCSGFVYYCLKGIGVDIKYQTSATWAKSKKYTAIATLNEMVPGDILCFSGHVGIYLGGNMMIDAVPSAGGVRIAYCASGYWASSFICGKRVLPPPPPAEPVPPAEPAPPAGPPEEPAPAPAG